MPEILAPAGNFEQLYAAVRCGANAVYMGSDNFNARRGAGNFDRGALKQAVQYCHTAGVKCYLALNTLICGDELEQAVAHAQYACQLGMDAIIVQDIGLAAVIRDCAPDMPLHASTQCSAHTPSAVRLLSQIGFSRVIAARECSKAEIEQMVSQNTAQIEIFVHGALCMSVSGQCYMSSIFGARSGNRGMCAQPCRLGFAAPDGCANALSLKDLSLINRMADIIKTGVHSIKIEGRLKRPEYVAAAVTACKSAITGGKCDDELFDRLQSVFSRSGFTDGYFAGKRDRSMFGIRRREDVTAANNDVLSPLSRLYDKEKPLIPIDIGFCMKKSQPAKISLSDGVNNINIEGGIPQQAVNRPLDKGRIEAQLKKTGSTIYYPKTVDIDMDDGLTLPISELNRLRRQATDELSLVRGKINPVSFEAYSPDIDKAESNAGPVSRFTARFGDMRSIPFSDDGFKKLALFDTIYVPIDSTRDQLKQFFDRCAEHGITPGVELPRALFGSDERYAERLNLAKDIGIDHCLVNNIGALELACEQRMNICGGFGLNIANRPALEEHSLCGLTSAVTSFELTLNRINKMAGIIPIGIILYGRLPLMLTRSCPLGGNCKSCRGHGKIVDRKGIEMPVICSREGREILNPMPLYMADRLDEVKTDFGMFHYTIESPAAVLKVIDCYNNRTQAPAKITRGLYYRAIE